METTALLKKLEQLPPTLKKEVEDFVDFLIYKNENSLSIEEAAPYYQCDENLSAVKVLEPKPVFGSGKGLFGKMADDFDAPLDEMKEYM